MSKQSTKHDYIARIEQAKGKFRYFYSKAEYDAYLHGKDKKKEESKPQKRTIENVLDKFKGVALDRIKNSKSEEKTNPNQEIGKGFISERASKSVKAISEKASDLAKDFVSKFSFLDVNAEKSRKEKLKEARTITDEDDAITRKMKLDEAKTVKKESIDDAYKRSVIEPRAKLIDGTTVRHDAVTDRYFYKDENGELYYSSPDKTFNFLGVDFTETRTGFKKTDEYGNDHMKDSWLKKVDTSKQVNQRSQEERQAEVDEYRKNEPEFLKDVKRYDPPKSYDEIQDEMNERFVVDKFYQNNCIFCSATYELKCRGYDVDVKDVHNILKNNDALTNRRMVGPDETGTKIVVTSNPLDSMYEDPISLNPATHTHNNGQYEKRLTHSMIENMYPKNSRGDISVVWVDSKGNPLGGHSMVFEIDKNGKMIIRDTQAHKTYVGAEIDKLLSHTDSRYTFTTRTDNLKFKKEFVNATRNN